MPIFNGVDNIANIYQGNNQILKVYQGENLKYELSLFGAYEEIADINVATATTQIDFDNLNITKDDELRLVYTLVGNTTVDGYVNIYPNDQTTNSNYHVQRLLGADTFIIANRFTGSSLRMIEPRSDRIVSGFSDIKISNNDRIVVQNQWIRFIGSQSSNIQNANYNAVGTQTITSITKLSVKSDSGSQLTTGSRLQLYKAVK